ncbi:linker histone H1M [Danio rerio]|uniref:Linker histone H1M n=1 Tax=Danio rerio TaxID=7955 RepID=Q4V956_DANRE|nr:linker histone H1M [Danio rerio]AAH97052.1 Linker histone H1M [Danio rerio]|eukprot:NP_898894.2 linker histone H1M [Danio rerio]
MAPKKAAAEPTATITKGSENEITETKPAAPEDSNAKSAARKVSPHPSTMEMVKEALKELDSRKGVSAQAIRGYIKEKYTTVDETRLKYMVRRALNKGMDTGVFVRPANSGSTTGAQGRFRIAAKTKAKEAKAQSKENADPNEPKATKPKKEKATKAKGEGATKEKPTKKKETTDDAKPKTSEQNGTASKVAPAKKPKAKNAAGEGGAKPKPSKAKASKEGAEEPATKKGGKKNAARAEDGESGAAATEKAPGKRAKK